METTCKHRMKWDFKKFKLYWIYETVVWIQVISTTLAGKKR